MREEKMADSAKDGLLLGGGTRHITATSRYQRFVKRKMLLQCGASHYGIVAYVLMETTHKSLVTMGRVSNRTCIQPVSAILMSSRKWQRPVKQVVECKIDTISSHGVDSPTKWMLLNLLFTSMLVQRGVCVGVSLPTGVCMFILTYCIVCTLFAGLFTWLISIFVLI